MAETFRLPASAEGKLFNEISIDSLREKAHTTYSRKVLEFVHERLLEMAFENPSNEEIQNLMMFAYLRLDTLSEWENITGTETSYDY